MEDFLSKTGGLKEKEGNTLPLTPRAHHALAQGRKDLGQRHRPAPLAPRFTIQTHKELVRPGSAKQQNLQRFVPAIILDRNSQVRFHKSMKTGPLTKINHARERARLSC